VNGTSFRFGGRRSVRLATPSEAETAIGLPVAVTQPNDDGFDSVCTYESGLVAQHARRPAIETSHPAIDCDRRGASSRQARPAGD
jgi:hypothetical protein